MKTFFVTFGREHTHTINDVKLDKDIVLQIDTAYPKSILESVQSIFGTNYSAIHGGEAFVRNNMVKDYPRGAVSLARIQARMSEEARRTINELLDDCAGDFHAFDEEFDGSGICFNCGEMVDPIEPDAQNVTCEHCQKPTVNGMLVTMMARAAF